MFTMEFPVRGATKFKEPGVFEMFEENAEACKRMRAERWGQRAHIVAISGWGQDEDRRKSRNGGLDGQLLKPKERATLQRVIAEVEPHAGA